MIPPPPPAVAVGVGVIVIVDGLIVDVDTAGASVGVDG